MYPHLDTALALSRSEQASLASINKELLTRNAQLRSRMRDLDELLLSRDKAIDTNARSASSTINTLQQSVMLMDQRLLKYQQRVAAQDEALANVESRLQISERERTQAQSDRSFLTQQLDQLKRAHNEELLSIKSRHQLELQRLHDELTGELSRLREQMLSDQRAQSQAMAEKQVLQARLATAEADRSSDRKALVEALANLETTRAELAETKRDSDQARSRVDALTLTTNQQSAQISSLNTRVQSLTKQLQASAEEIVTWKADAEAYHKDKLELQASLANEKEIVEDLKVEIRQQRDANAVAQHGRQDALEQLEAERAEVNRLERKLQARLAENEALKQKLIDANVAQQRSVAREESLMTQIAEMNAQHQDAIAAIQAARNADIEVLREKARQSEAALHELRHKLRSAQAELNIAIDNTEVGSQAVRSAHLRSLTSSLASPSPRRPLASSFSNLSSSASSSSSSSSSSSTSASSTKGLNAGNFGTVTPPRGVYASSGLRGPETSTLGTGTQVTTTTTLSGSGAAPVRIDITPLKNRYQRD